MTTIIVAIITAVSAVVCQLIIATENRKEMRQTQYDSQKLIEYKINELSERVHKYNNYVERTYILEKDTAVMKRELESANHRIEDLERSEHK
jgi:hypothetical protein